METLFLTQTSKLLQSPTMPRSILTDLDISEDDIEFEEPTDPPNTVPATIFEAFPVDQAVDPLITEDELRSKDLDVINYTTRKLSAGWNVATDVDDYCKMTLATIKLLELRRRTLDMPYKKQAENPLPSSTHGEPFEDK